MKYYYICKLTNKLDNFIVDRVQKHPITNQPVVYYLTEDKISINEEDNCDYSILFTEKQDMIKHYEEIEEYEICKIGRAHV